jgi:alpha,alpha-trehalose phosphorylase
MRHSHRVIKQADIILAMYLLQNEFTLEQMKEAYNFYEPMTLHFSSLSYNTHSIIANKIGLHKQAYNYFRKAAGLDLDDLRQATKDGLHAAALGGTWQTVIYGFLGMKINDDSIMFEPKLPDEWKSISLRLKYRGSILILYFSQDVFTLKVEGWDNNNSANLIINGESWDFKDGLSICLNHAEYKQLNKEL